MLNAARRTFWIALAAISFGQPPAVFHAGTRLVEIDVVVRDAHGYVTGLAKDDFTLWDCKASQRSPYMDQAHRLAPCKDKRQAIDLFREVSSARVKPGAGPGTAPAAAGPPLPPGAVTNRIYADGERLTNGTAVIIDQLNTPFELKGYERKTVAQFLKSLNGTNRIAVYSLGSNLHLLQDFTSDPGKLIDAVSKLDAGDAAAKPGSDGGDNSHIAEVEEQVYRDIRTNGTVDAIRELVKHMQAVPGRRSIVWISGSFDFFDPPFGPPVARGLLGAANIAVYPVSVRTLTTGGIARVDGLVGVKPSPGVVQRPPGIGVLEAQFDTMRLGESLGGSGFKDASEALKAVKAADADARNYYVLGFYPAEEDLDGTGHQVSLEVAKKVSKRADLTLEYRRIYMATKASASEERRPAIGDLIRDPLDATSIGLAARVMPDPHAPGRRVVETTVDLADIQLRREQDKWAGSFDVAMRLETMQNGTLMATPPMTLTVAVSLTDAELEAKRASGWVVTGPLPDDARTGFVHVVVEDAANGAAGSVRAPIEAMK